MSESDTHWGSFVEEAQTNSDLPQLARVVVTRSTLLISPNFLDTEPGRFGRPSVSRAKAAGASLLALTDGNSSADAMAYRAIGLTAVRAYSAAASDKANAMRMHRDDLRVAATLASGLDPLLELFVLDQLGRRERDCDDGEGARRAASLMVAIVEATEGSLTDSLLTVLLPPGVVRPIPIAFDRYRVQAYVRAYIAARYCRDYAAAIRAADQRIMAANLVVERHPYLLATALGARAAVARAIGDLATNKAMRKRQVALAQEQPTPLTLRTELLSRGDEAEYFDDFATHRHALLERLNLLLVAHGGAADPTPIDVAKVALAWKYAYKGPQLNSLGNICYSLSVNLLRSGACAASKQNIEEARQWLDAAEASWRFVASNGTVAIAYRRLELDRMQGRIRSARADGRRLVVISKQFRRPLGQRRAAIDAARFGPSGDLAVRKRLRVLIADAPPTDLAHLSLGMANWHARAGFAHEALLWAARARDGLVLDGGEVILDSRAVIEAAEIEAAAMLALRGDRSRRHVTFTRRDELQARARALPAIARRLAGAQTESAQRIANEEARGFLVEALELALAVEDFVIVNRVMEVARRDASGMILSGLARDPEAPTKVAELATDLLQALAATAFDVGSQGEVDQSTGDSPEEEEVGAPPGNAPSDAGSRGTAAQKGFVDAINVLGVALGPVAKAVFDPRTVETASPRSLLEESPSGSAVLSFWLVAQAGDRNRRSGRRSRRRRKPALFWSLTTRAHATISEYGGKVSVSAELVNLDFARREQALFDVLRHHGQAFLPRELEDFLQIGDGSDHMVPALTIVPTGCLGIPFAALTLSDGRRLLDAAAISIVSSLSAGIAISGQSGSAEGNPVAVYDLRSFPDAEGELAQLTAVTGTVARVATLRELAESLAGAGALQGPSLLALAVHGKRGTDGWSATKTLPSGETLHTAHILTWDIPALVVGASCNTDICADGAERIGGFPLAFTLRGARSVIGTLYYVEDPPTVHLMTTFYDQVRQTDSARALRTAQRRWLEANPESPESQWALFLAYGVPVPGIASSGSVHHLKPDTDGVNAE